VSRGDHRARYPRLADEDLTQDAFIKVWRSAESYRPGRGSVRTWFLSVVRNQGIDRLRARASRRRTQEKAETSAPTCEPSEAFARAWHEARQGLLPEALAALPPLQRQVLELVHFSGLTHMEIAERLQLPPGTPSFGVCHPGSRRRNGGASGSRRSTKTPNLGHRSLALIIAICPAQKHRDWGLRSPHAPRIAPGSRFSAGRGAPRRSHGARKHERGQDTPEQRPRPSLWSAAPLALADYEPPLVSRSSSTGSASLVPSAPTPPRTRQR
jgi:RNA polymerase sigma factor (sigma-70 family)